MSEHEGFVDVIGALEPGAIAGSIAGEAHNRLAETLELTIDSLGEQDRELNQLQRIELLRNASQAFDGFEGYVFNVLMDDLNRIRMREVDA
jgi:hypothetical protein